MLLLSFTLAISSPAQVTTPAPVLPDSVIQSAAVFDGRVQTTVSTLAGDGVAGMRDGVVGEARFLEPFAVAYDGRGRLYVADRAAQRIRMVDHGTVTTVAGSGDLDISGQHVAGGYADGPAASARFNEPTGIAVGADGSLYVADSLNHCIRRISNGVVTTVAGAPDRPKPADGLVATAGFEDPRALAFDGDGNLYVADYEFGVRRIDRQSNVTTLPTDGLEKELTGVAAYGSGSTLRIAATDNHALDVYTDIAKPATIIAATETERPMGNPYGVAIAGPNQYVVADAMSHDVSLVRSPLPPFVTSWFETELVGMGRTSRNLAAGFADGTTFTAKLDAPTAVAISPEKIVAIADSGNRRIRLAPLPDMRMPVGDRISVFGEYTSAYKIAFVSSSQAHYTHWFPDSTAGQIELGLQANWRSVGLPRKPVLFSARVDGGGAAGSLWDWAEQVPGQGLADLVVLSVYSGDVPDDPRDPWGALTRKVAALKKSLAKNGVKLFVAVYPVGDEVSPNESIRVRDRDPLDTVDDMRFEDFAVNENKYVQALQNAHVPYYSAYRDLVEYSKGARMGPLYGLLDSHFTEEGSALYGRYIERALEASRPWQ